MTTYSIAIATYNRAGDLADTLRSLAEVDAPDGADLELIVVDNNSTDDTRAVVERAAAGYPYPLRYEFERTQGRSAALNHAFQCARGDIVITTDDDVRVPRDWVVQYARAFAAHGCGYAGGRVLPLWGGPPPPWLASSSGPMWAVIALLDFGPDAKEFTTHVPLGVNMAFTREAIVRTGGFDPNIGRRAGTLLGQEVREWGLRARAAGIRGMYVPEIWLRHVVPASRLCKSYFRRWFYWRGVSRAMLYAQTGADMESPERATIDPSVPHIAGVPRYLFRSALAAARDMVRHRLRGRKMESFERELWLWFFAGIVRERWRHRERPLEVRTGAAAAGLHS
jgi:glycosyltransferase involved in cell wall biosynthesis